MNAHITNKKLSGTVAAIASKSHAHRVLIATALAGQPLEAVAVPDVSEDIEATLQCLAALEQACPVFDCGESGSTLRFLLPIAMACKRKAVFLGAGRLPERPLSPLRERMEAHGCVFLFPRTQTGVNRERDIFVPDGDSEGSRFHQIGDLGKPCQGTVDQIKDLDSAITPRTRCGTQVDANTVWHENSRSDKKEICTVDGPLAGGRFSLPGDVSSQFITGLLFALPLLPESSEITLTSPLQSAGYVAMTLRVLEAFGIRIEAQTAAQAGGAAQTNRAPQATSPPNGAAQASGTAQADGASGAAQTSGAENQPHAAAAIEGDPPAAAILGGQPGAAYTAFRIAGNQRYTPAASAIEGDWSNAAFWFAAGALSGYAGTGGAVSCTGLDPLSAQGDRAVLPILRAFGAATQQHSVAASLGKLRGIEVDAANIPDLIPILAVVASVSAGTTRIINAERLRLKESDRLRTTADCLNALGADVRELPGGLIITGRERLKGGTVSGCNDHRIVMAMAIAATCCEAPVTIEGMEAINKSYPRFFDDFKKLGGDVRVCR